MTKKQSAADKPKADRMGKIYREYTRIKYKKYKLQFPLLKESEIIVKIIHEWDAMDEEAKMNLEKKFIERSGHGFLELDSSSSKKKRDLKGGTESVQKGSKPISKGKKKKKISPKVRVFEEKTDPKKKDENSDFKRSDEKKSGKKSTPDKDEDSSLKLRIGSSKYEGDQKSGKTREGYLSFFKYYYERLSAEHPRWNKNQITTIIKLLWRRRQKVQKKERSKPMKRLSGRQMYRRVKEAEGFLRAQVKQMWRSLPHESKKFWQIKGSGRPHKSKRDSSDVRRVLNLGAVQATFEDPHKNYQWMDKMIS